MKSNKRPKRYRPKYRTSTLERNDRTLESDEEKFLNVWDQEFLFKYKVEGQTTESDTIFISMSELVTLSSFIEVDDYLFMSL